MDNKIQKELASNGILRAAINMSNFLLVTDKTKDGTPIGVSPDMAKKLAFLPGAGQFYNNKYLKGTVLFLTEAYSLYQIDKFSKLAVISQRNSFIWLAIITYAYSFIDAHVDAELSSFPDKDNVLNEEK